MMPGPTKTQQTQHQQPPSHVTQKIKMQHTVSWVPVERLFKTTTHTWAGRHAMQQRFDHVFVVVDDVGHGYTCIASIDSIH
jgi:hypothetical protein